MAPERSRSVFPAECLPEIELAFVATLWHEPDRLAEVMRWLVPEVHLRQPYLRLVLEALALTYSELGACDWSSVLSCLLHQGQLEECGGVHSLDALYSCRFYPPLFGYYVEEIKRAGLERTEHDYVPPSRFSGGTGELVVNKLKHTPKSPKWVGSATIAGTRYQIKAWPALAVVNLRFYPQ